MFLPEPRATLLYPAGPGNDPRRNHLFVLLTGSSGPGRQVLMVPISTRRTRSDETCAITVDDHSFIQHDSVVEYRHARIEPAEKLVRGVDAGEFIEKEQIHPELFERICAGLFMSPYAKPFAADFLRQYHVR